LGSSHRTDDAKFVISVSCREAGSSGPYLTFKSSPFDAGGKMKVFCDTHWLALEPGIDGAENVFTKSFDDSTQDAVQLAGEGKYEHWQRGFGSDLDDPFWPISDVYHFCLQNPPNEYGWTYPHDEPLGTLWAPVIGGTSYGKVGMQTLFLAGKDARVRTSSDSSTDMGLFTRLFDDSDWGGAPNDNHDVGIKNLYCGRRRGGTFFASYGGKALASGILSSSPAEYAMDMTQTTGKFQWWVFNTGYFTVANTCDNSGGMNIAAAGSGICGLAAGWAMFFPASVPLSVSLGTAAGILGVVASFDTDTGIADKAEGVLLTHFVRASYPYSGVIPYHMVTNIVTSQVINTNGSTTVPDLNINIDTTDYQVGELLTAYAQIASGSSIVTRIFNPIDVKSDVSFGCVGGGGQTAAQDFGSWTVKMWVP